MLALPASPWLGYGWVIYSCQRHPWGSLLGVFWGSFPSLIKKRKSWKRYAPFIMLLHAAECSTWLLKSTVDHRRQARGRKPTWPKWQSKERRGSLGDITEPLTNSGTLINLYICYLELPKLIDLASLMFLSS